MDTGPGLLRTWYAYLLLYFYIGIYSIRYADGGRHFGFRATYYVGSLVFLGEVPSGGIARYSVVFLSLCCVLRTRYLTCAVFPLASWRSHVDYFWSPFPCSVFCFFVPGTLTYAVFPSGDDSILYADDRRHFGFLAKYYLYSHGLFGEAPSGDIGFHT